MAEEVLFLKDSGRCLVGVLTHPEPEVSAGPKTAVVLLNSGLLYRVGPNRISVMLARAVAANGFMSCRFDFSGIGDSAPAAGTESFEERCCGDLRLVVDYLERERGIERVVLFGICSGADAALVAGLRDPRVEACILVNGCLISREVRIAAIPKTIARTKARYYTKRLFSWRSLINLFTFKSDYGQLFRTFKRLLVPAREAERTASDSGPSPDSFLERLANRDVRILMIYSEGSPALDFYNSFLAKKVRDLQLLRKPLSLVTVPNADHVFTLAWSQRYLIEISRKWLAELN